MPPAIDFLQKAKRRSRIGTLSLLITVLSVASAANGQTTSEPAPKEAISDYDRLRAARAKAKLEEESAPKSRYWDRDADGKRPWERSESSPQKR